jgi:hypothetical protein
MRFDHDNFYRRLSNCQRHHTVHISVVVSTTRTHYKDSTQYSNQYTRTRPTTSSPSLVSICNNRPTDSIIIVPYVDTLGSRQWNTEYTSTEGVQVARNGHVLATNSNPVTSHDPRVDRFR